MTDISIGGITLLRVLRTAWKGLVFAFKNPYAALRHIQNLKWWGLCWDFRGFLGMSAQAAGPVYIGCLQAFGDNKSRMNIRDIGGHIQSNITGDRLPLTMEGMTPEETNGVPAKCRFFIQALFRDPTSEREGIIEEKFLQVWRDFSFVFTADGKEYRYRFRKGEVVEIIGRFRQPMAMPQAPKITRKASQ